MKLLIRQGHDDSEWLLMWGKPHTIEWRCCNWDVAWSYLAERVAVCREGLKCFFGLTDEQLREDVLVEYEVRGGSAPDGFGGTMLLGQSTLLDNQRIRYGRNEKPKGEAQTLLEKHEEDPGCSQRWEVIEFLLRREAEREAEKREAKDEPSV